jgi:hypothetical protein
MMNLNDVTDRALLDEPLGGVMRAVPGNGPVDRQIPPGVLHGVHHPARLRDARCEGLFDHDVQAVRRDFLDVIGVLCGS